MPSSTPNKSAAHADTHDAKASSTDKASRSASQAAPAGAKILPPTSPVDVPRMPPPVAEPAEVPDLSDPRGNTTSWADSPEADPHKKTARTSINNG